MEVIWHVNQILLSVKIKKKSHIFQTLFFPFIQEPRCQRAGITNKNPTYCVLNNLVSTGRLKRHPKCNLHFIIQSDILRHFPALKNLEILMPVPPTFHSNDNFLINRLILKILVKQNFNSSFTFENGESSTQWYRYVINKRHKK